MTEASEPAADWNKRFAFIMWVGVAMILVALLAVVLSAGVLLSDRGEVVALARANQELSHRSNRLRAEVAVRDARFQASKGLARGSSFGDDLAAIQAVVDRYALDNLRNGGAEGKTSDDVRREVCDALATAGFPCAP